MYTAKYILRDAPDAKIDFVERLPVPFGLVRFGVAPDHPEAKIVINDFSQSILTSPNVRFRGNVEVGVDISLEQLRQSYDSVVLAVGARGSKNLGIEGENLEGVHDAREFVAWYNGHPDFADADFDLDNVSDVVVIGNGNVALDVARILLKTPEELQLTDIPLHVQEKLKKSAVERIGVYGRRGPVQSAFTIAELREITTSALRPVIVQYNTKDIADLGFTAEDTPVDLREGDLIRRSGLIVPTENFNNGFNPASEEEASARALKRKTDLLRSLPEKIKAIGVQPVKPNDIAEHQAYHQEMISQISFDPENSPEIKPIPNDRTLVLDFLMSPARFEASIEHPTQVSRVVFEKTELTGPAGKQSAVNTNQFVTIPSKQNRKLLVLKSVGYRSLPFEEVPFDSRRNIFPTGPGGRVINPENNDLQAGLYATGWARRGPTGIIGTNIGDARETAGSVCDDLSNLLAQGTIKSSDNDIEAIWSAIGQKKLLVDKAACIRILDHEKHLGTVHNVHRVKVSHLRDLLEISQIVPK